MARRPVSARRFAINQGVTLTVVGDPPISLPGQIRHLGAADFDLSLDRPLDLGAILKIRWNRTVLFGEVTSCESTRGDYRLALKLWHVLFESPDVAEGWKQLFDGPEAGKTAKAGQALVAARGLEPRT
ncbi:MAG: hypothetical protein ACKV22_41725 [Bryobacteraceae bacterium]